MRPIVTLPLLLLLCLLVVGCTPGLPQSTVVGPRTFKNTVDIEINGFRRTYLVHVPTGYTPDIPLPLVVVIHGAFDTAQGMERVSGFSLLADREGFIVLYPNGMGILGFLQHWNAGHCCGKAADDQVTMWDLWPRHRGCVQPAQGRSRSHLHGGVLQRRHAGLSVCC